MMLEGKMKRPGAHTSPDLSLVPLLCVMWIQIASCYLWSKFIEIRKIIMEPTKKGIYMRMLDRYITQSRQFNMAENQAKARFGEFFRQN